MRAGPGFTSGQLLKGGDRLGNYVEDLDNLVGSLRVHNDTVVTLFGGYSRSASQGARTFVGPADVPDLAALGFGGKTSAVQVWAFRSRPSGAAGWAEISSQTNGSGPRRRLPAGDYDGPRLAGSEVEMNGNIRSVCSGPGALTILYEGAAFDPVKDSVVIEGSCVLDLERIGMFDRVGSLRILSQDNVMLESSEPARQPARQPAERPAVGPALAPISAPVTVSGPPRAAPPTILILLIVLLTLLGLCIAFAWAIIPRREKTAGINN